MKRALVAIVLLLAACGGEQVAVESSPVAQAPGPLGDTWTYDGTKWHATTVKGPSPRYLAALAYDPPHNDYVLFGGQAGAIDPSGETWTFDGRSWKKMTPVHNPDVRRNAALAYDPAHRYVLLFGGENNLGEGNALNDTWSWDGGAWTPVTAGPGPAGRHSAAVVWDSGGSSLFVFGGTGVNPTAGPGANGSPLGDAWTLKDGKWTQIKGEGPPPLADVSAVNERGTKRVDVLLGMACPNPVASAWGWDGTSWSQLADPGMSARWGAAVAQAPDGAGLLFGGSNETGC